MVKTEPETCKECGEELADDGTCPGCGWSKNEAAKKEDDMETDEWGEEEETEEEEEE